MMDRNVDHDGVEKSLLLSYLSKKMSRRRWILVVLLLLVGVAFLGRRWFKPLLRWVERRYYAHLGDSGPLQFIKRGTWRQHRPGMWLRTDLLKRKRHWSRVRLYTARFSPEHFRVDLWVGKPKKVGWIMRRTDAVAAINGGLFDTRRRPLGLLKWRGRVRNRHLHRRRIDGVFFADKKHFGIAPGRGFRHAAFATAFQSAPMLVARGRRVPLHRPWIVDRRSALCIDHKGNLLLTITGGLLNGLSFYELSLLLVAKPKQGGFSCRWALNLDGGSSSQWAVKTPLELSQVSGLEAVPLYLLVYPRQTHAP